MATFESRFKVGDVVEGLHHNVANNRTEKRIGEILSVTFWASDISYQVKPFNSSGLEGFCEVVEPNISRAFKMIELELNPPKPGAVSE